MGTESPTACLRKSTIKSVSSVSRTVLLTPLSKFLLPNNIATGKVLVCLSVTVDMSFDSYLIGIRSGTTNEFS